MYRKVLSLIVALGVITVFSMFGRTGTGTAATLPSGERTFGQTVLEPAYDGTTGGLIYLSTPMHAHVNPNVHDVAPLYLVVYPTSAPVGTLSCEDIPVENCPDHGPWVAGIAESAVPGVYGSGVQGHDHIGAIASSGGDFNVLWEPILVLFTNSQAANTMHLTTLAAIKSAEASGDAFEIPLPALTFHGSVVSESAYAHGVPFTG